MLENIILNARKNYEIISKIIKNCKTKNELINKVRQENVIIDEYKDIVNIKKVFYYFYNIIFKIK